MYGRAESGMVVGEARESEDHCAIKPMLLLLECPRLLHLAVSTARDGVM